MVSDDGEFFDHFNYGYALTGLTAARLEGTPAIILSTTDHIAAFGISEI